MDTVDWLVRSSSFPLKCFPVLQRLETPCCIFLISCRKSEGIRNELNFAHQIYSYESWIQNQVREGKVRLELILMMQDMAEVASFWRPEATPESTACGLQQLWQDF